MKESTTSCIVRAGQLSELPEVLLLIKELARFEKAPNEAVLTLVDLERDFLDNRFQFLVAVRNTEVLGMALYFDRYSTWKGRSIHLEDLIVRESHRGKGIGSALFHAVVHVAKKEQAARLQWEVLDWNTPALSFYKSLNAEILSDWWPCRLNRNQIESWPHE